MSKELVNALVQLLISLGGAGLVVQLLLLRQNRRKIAGDASSAEANAASTPSGAAMQMVENAQTKEKDAEARADVLEQRLSERTQFFEERRDRDGQELENRAWRIHHLEMRVALLEHRMMQTGVEIPPDTTATRQVAGPPPPTPPQISPRPRPAIGPGDDFGL